MKVLVTGATGFFGPEILSRLRTAGHLAVAASRRAVMGDDSWPLDITSRDSCEAVIRRVKPDVVVHAAALAHVPPGRVSEDLCRRTNIGGVERMLEASAQGGVRRFVFISSVIVYGECDLPVPVTERHPAVAHGIYGASKIAAEGVCKTYTARLDCVVLRMATMYAPGEVDNIRKRVRPFSRFRRTSIAVAPARPRYSLCSRRNGAEAVLWAVDGRLAPDTYNAADQRTYRQAEIIRAVERAGGPGRVVPVPPWLPRTMWRAARPVLPARLRASIGAKYWKFCEPSVYSSDKLRASGLEMPPDLLHMESS